MKVIHCADLHLDSKLNANLDKERATLRNRELLSTFGRMVDYAVMNQVEAILIAGDLFDTKRVSRTTGNVVLQKISANPRLRFYYLRGNHDDDNSLKELPENLYLFEDTWITYLEGEGNIAISGLELTKANSDTAALSLVLKPEQFNIVLLHGQEAESKSKEKAEQIPLRELRNKGIDYLALGHVHAYKKEKLDARGVYCYPGCLEGRGFDECGEHGFVVLDISEELGTYTHTFVPFAARRLHTVQVDVTGCMSTMEMLQRAGEAIRAEKCAGEDLIKVVLKGSLDVTCEKDVAFLQTSLAEDYFFLKLQDATTLLVEEQDYSLDESLKGEFVRTVMGDDKLSVEEKGEIIRYGLQALAGEEIG